VHKYNVVLSVVGFMLMFNVSRGRQTCTACRPTVGLQAVHDWRAADIFIVVFEVLTFPNTWEPLEPCDPYRRPQLSPESSEYKKVLENVMKTAGSSVKQIIKVCIDLHSSLHILNA